MGNDGITKSSTRKELFQVLAEEGNSGGADFVVDLGAVDGRWVKSDFFVEQEFAAFGDFVKKDVVACTAGDECDGSLFDF